MIGYYLKYWGIREPVFHRSLNPSECFIPQRYQRYLDHLLILSQQPYTIQILTGQGGLGKSSLARWIYSQTPPSKTDCYLLTLHKPESEPGWLIRGVAEFLAGPGKDKECVRKHTARGLDQLREEKRSLLIIIDAAENLQKACCFSDILHIHNLAYLSGSHFSVLLAGREPPDAVTGVPELLRNKVTLHWSMPPLSRRDAGHYLKWYCYQSKMKKNPFSPQSVDALYKYSQGIPAVLNALAENCLIEAALKKTRLVHPDIVENMYQMSGRGIPPKATPSAQKPGGPPPAPPGGKISTENKHPGNQEPLPWDQEKSRDPDSPAEIGFSLFEEP